ncbi:MAG: VacJ family lipoprotein [Alphaproteobacteria bacterium]|nr:VacJ family lipoprotein [Alphaproteobacteria bacterium]
MVSRGAISVALLAGCAVAVAAFAATAQGNAGAAYRDQFAAVARAAAAPTHQADSEALRRRRVETALAPLVVAAIARQPRQAETVIRAALAAAPTDGASIARRAMAAFPGFAARIAAVAGLPAAQPPAFAPHRPSPLHPPAGLSGLARPRGTIRPSGRAARAAAWAVSALAANSAALERIIPQAIAKAPGEGAAVVAALSTAYPLFARRIAAASVLSPPAPLARIAAAPVRQAAPVIRPAPASPPAALPPAPAAPQPVIAAPRPGEQERTVGLTRQPAEGGDLEADASGIADPLEPMNRIIFAFNDTVDLVILRPIAWVYGKVMPDPALRAVRRFFANLQSPVIVVNDLLQGDLADAGVAVGRFGINTTIGVLGLFDPAESFGLERHHADFGQTMHSHGLGAGPYLVLPLLGPASTRDGVGKIFDLAFHPFTWILSTGQNLAIGATRAVVGREELLEPLDELRETSVDYYTGMKSAYWQNRQVKLGKGAEMMESGAYDKLFDEAK